jgi:hypothetical protein
MGRTILPRRNVPHRQSTSKTSSKSRAYGRGESRRNERCLGGCENTILAHQKFDGRHALGHQWNETQDAETHEARDVRERRDRSSGFEVPKTSNPRPSRQSRSAILRETREDYLFEYVESGEWDVVEWIGGRSPCRRPRLRGDTRWGKAPPLISSIWVTISSIASATRPARGRSSVQYTAFRRRSMSGVGRETVTRCFCEGGDGSIGWCIPLRTR